MAVVILFNLLGEALSEKYGIKRRVRKHLKGKALLFKKSRLK
ncbi:hypothetical protein CGLO_09989 [Colletotrichum gloeosporioides Cg-14]|uniref:Uncharacterized protein n=1 Tax=Colletotrichum gloeosporioides (strain Cg-14) TaxID=1237896 RepID=T0LQS3_COLGC|nr:hypothetical protein CGLO_09989 [Colletotrichum gloeosporioides Cg-14]